MREIGEIWCTRKKCRAKSDIQSKRWLLLPNSNTKGQFACTNANKC